ncbi:NYN domain-containing protein (plasmid) [Azospirillum thermophilum]|uniref:NYN domain-containing protein n=2 Tax=Azospirillum thermophilum TaxID=2202148 RepID=A0A2S2CZ91_9PROT|nr:NYN domain-containing protein [Azospirillum thermophilum]
MDRAAVFVDAGYLFAQGSAAISGQKQKRTDLVLDEAAVRAELVDVVRQTCGLPLLRIYWYDGAPTFRGPTAEHTRIANSPDMKLRLGYVNGAGEQKGVDAMIVTDMIELARNGAMSDAVLLSGDEDIRIGVQVAQTFGVRVHLLGIHPSRGSQGPLLLQEADTTTEWDATTIGRFLSMPQPASATAPAPHTVRPPPTPGGAAATPTASILQHVTLQFVGGLSALDLASIETYWAANNNRGVPPEFDRQLLKLAAQTLGSPLDDAERPFVRQTFHKEVKARLATAASTPAAGSAAAPAGA